MIGSRADDFAEFVLAASSRRFGHASDPTADALGRVRQRDAKFYPTLASSLEVLGRRVGPEWDAERTRLQGRLQRLHDVAGVAVGAGATILKGSELAAFYPEPILRYSGDVDLHVPDLRTAWEVGTSLRDRGWEVAGLVLFPGRPGSEPDVLLQWERERPATDEADDLVEVSTLVLQGDGLRMDRVRDLPTLTSPARLLAAVAAEGMDRPFGLRDMIDAHLVLQRLAHAQLRALWSAAGPPGLSPYLDRLLRQAQRALGTPVPGDAGRTTGAGPAERFRGVVTRARAGGRRGSLLRLAQTVATFSHRSLAVTVLDRLAAGVSADDALRWGAALFCRLVRGPAHGGLEISGRNEIRTPLGTFVALPGTAIPVDVADRLGIVQ